MKAWVLKLAIFNIVFSNLSWILIGFSERFGVDTALVELINKFCIILINVTWIYITWIFYHFKNVIFLFYLNLAGAVLYIVAGALFLFFTLRDGVKPDPDMTYMLTTAGLEIVFFVGILLSKLRRERLFVILAILGISLECMKLTGLTFDLKHVLGISGLVHFIIPVLWIMIFYRELSLMNKEELLDQ